MRVPVMLFVCCNNFYRLFNDFFADKLASPLKKNMSPLSRFKRCRLKDHVAVKDDEESVFDRTDFGPEFHLKEATDNVEKHIRR